MIHGMNKREETLLSFLHAHKNKAVSIEQLADVLYANRDRPQSWRNACLVVMRNLILKAKAYGNIEIERVSRLGAGGRAQFRLNEEFSKSRKKDIA